MFFDHVNYLQFNSPTVFLFIYFVVVESTSTSLIDIKLFKFSWTFSFNSAHVLLTVRKDPLQFKFIITFTTPFAGTVVMNVLINEQNLLRVRQMFSRRIVIIRPLKPWIRIEITDVGCNGFVLFDFCDEKRQRWHAQQVTHAFEVELQTNIS